MFVFLNVFIEKWHFQFLPNWFCMLIFFLLAPQHACAAFLQSLSILSPCFYLSHNSLWFQGFGSWCSWMLISCSGSSFFHIRIAYHSSFVHGSFSNWQFIYLSDYLPRRHTFTCFPGLLMSAFWSSLPLFLLLSFLNFLRTVILLFHGCFHSNYLLLLVYLHLFLLCRIKSASRHCSEIFSTMSPVLG